MLNRISPQEIRRRYLNLKGIASKCFAYKGPDVIQVDLTDKCNGHCTICWLHSPIIAQDEQQHDELDFATLQHFLHDASKSGTKEVIFSGGGEPFCHSKIWDVFSCCEKSGLPFRITTNLTLLSESDIPRLLSFGKLLSLTVSVWAADADTYSITHNRDPAVFGRVLHNLKMLNTQRSARLEVKLYTVISRINFRKLKDIAQLACETGCSAVEFSIIDAIPGITDRFLLTSEQLEHVKNDLKVFPKDLRGIKIVNKQIVLERIANSEACYGKYDTPVGQMPCYAGWFFLRLRANGDFNSCLKSHRLPIGNVYREDLDSVWNGHKQQEFRRKCLVIPRDWEYFSKMGNGQDEFGCRRICDNRLVNERVFRVMRLIGRMIKRP